MAEHWDHIGDGIVVDANGKQVASVFPMDREQRTALIAAAPTTAAELTQVKAVNVGLRDALTKIKKGGGRFSMDPLEHATNCIEDMQAVARAALAADTP